MMSDAEMAARLVEIERELPRLAKNRNTFPREFEDRTDRLCGELTDEQQLVALDRLKEMVDRHGINR